jgi:hypothetical protein
MSRHTATPWKNCILVNEDDSSPTLDEIGEYVKTTAKQSDLKDFHFIMVTKEDGKEYDVCHVGNGPDSAANCRHITICVNAHQHLVTALDSVLALSLQYKLEESDPVVDEARALLAELAKG